MTHWGHYCNLSHTDSDTLKHLPMCLIVSVGGRATLSREPCLAFSTLTIGRRKKKKGKMLQGQSCRH